jgi:hypothetical protein
MYTRVCVRKSRSLEVSRSIRCLNQDNILIYVTYPGRGNANGSPLGLSLCILGTEFLVLHVACLMG